VKLGGVLGHTDHPGPQRNLRALAITAAFSFVAVSVIGYVNSECISLVVWSSNEKSQLLQDIAEKYNDGNPAVDRRCVRVKVSMVASGDGEQALTRDWPTGNPTRPDVWWPAATTWVLLLKEHRQERRLSDIVPAVSQKLIQSPLVIAMPEQMADTLKRSGEVVGWSSILKFAQDPQGWSRYNKPWGRFRLGKTNPMISTSGLHALIGTYSAAAATTDPLTPSEVRRSDVRAFVHGVESSVVHYGESVATFLDNFWNADDLGDALGYVSAVAVEEKHVFDYNRGNPRSLLCDPVCPKLAPREKLVALYPSEGTLIADHPYVILNWVDSVHRQAALDFQRHLETDAIQGRFQKEGFRDQNLSAGTVLQAPYFDRLQPRTRLLPPSPSLLAEIQASWSDLRKRAHVLIAIDVGRSMTTLAPDQQVTKLELAKRAASDAVSLLEPDDEVGLWVFSTNGDRPYREIVPMSPLGTGKSELARRIETLESEAGMRQLFATVLAGVDYVRSRLVPDRINALVVLGDGIDEGTRVNFFDLQGSLRRQPNDERVRVFTISYSTAASGQLRQLAEASPGAFYDASDPAKTITKLMRDVISNF
jgi:Ca-activated chloride channel family protein